MYLFLFFINVLTSFLMPPNVTMEFNSPQKVQRICADQYDLDFELVNETGYDISEVFISPTKESSWGEDVMGEDILADGQSVDIFFTTKVKAKKWDIYVTWVGYDSDEDVYWIGFDLSKISRITLYYNQKTGETWAETE